MSGLSISPQVWGPRLWKSLHTIAFAYPEQPTADQQQAARNFLQSLAYLLPCEKCRQHYSEYLQANPPAVENRTTFAMYLNKFHNSVNARLGKDQVAYDANRPYGKTKTNWLAILGAIVFGILIGLIVKQYL